MTRDDKLLLIFLAIGFSAMALVWYLGEKVVMYDLS